MTRTNTEQPEALMRLADNYADACFDQGLNQRTTDDQPETEREKLEKAIRRMHDTCEACQGNGEVVTDWNRYTHPHPGDKGDEAVSMCQECNGTGEVNAARDAEKIDAALATQAKHGGAT